MQKITLEYLLSSRNVDNKIYLCDIDRWLGKKIDTKDRLEIRDKLMELQGEYGQDK